MAFYLAGGRRSSRLVATTAILGLSWAAPAAAETPDDGLSEKAASQIAALQQMKTSLSAGERKLDSRLLVTLRRREGATRIPHAATGAAVSAAGTTVVDVRAASADAGLLKRLRALGARIREVSPRTGVVRARIPLRQLEKVASWRDVRRVGVAAGWISAHMPLRAAESKAAEAARLEAALAPVASQGDKAHAADAARAQLQVTGVGVKVCVLSDGVDALVASQAAGELPEVDVLPEQEGAGDEGTAMLEIVHDLAPNAELGFATAVSGDAEFADNVRALRFQAGCDVLVDDILYFNESPFQDGIIARAVNDVTADGALYFSSAGNEGNTLDGTSGSYEGRLRGLGSRRRQVRRRGARLRSWAGCAGLRSDLGRLGRRRAGHVVLGRSARRGRERLRPLPVQRRRQRRRLLPGRPGRERRPLRAPVHRRTPEGTACGSRSSGSRDRRGTSSCRRCAGGSPTRRTG